MWSGARAPSLITVSLMGGATFAIGLLPTFNQVGILAPILLITMRILQGMAIGGEYGGAAVYVAEHSEPDKRGWHTGWIQTSAAFGLVGALAIILITRTLSAKTPSAPGAGVSRSWRPRRCWRFRCGCA